MMARLRGHVGFSLLFVAAGMVHAEQITSTCKITAIDAAAHTVTLVRKTASGEKTGVAKVADTVKVTIDGQAAALTSLALPTDATVVYDTAVTSVVEIRVAKTMAAAGPTSAGTAPPLAIAPFDVAKAKEHQEAWAKFLGVPVEITNSIGMKLVLIPPGDFNMGSTDAQLTNVIRGSSARFPVDADDPKLQSEKPVHLVRISRPFRMGIYEVTVAQFRRFVDATDYRTDAERNGRGGVGLNLQTGVGDRASVYSWRNPGFPQTDQHPVANVSHTDAEAFCRWLTTADGRLYRLPTEAQWEFACRAGTTSLWSSGDTEESLRSTDNVCDQSLPVELRRLRPAGWAAAWNDGQPFTAAVGRFHPNAFGLYDVHGNVSEWCADWFDLEYYRNSSVADPCRDTPARQQHRDFSSDVCVRRGGNAIDNPWLCRSGSRHSWEKSSCECFIGFRVVCEPSPSQRIGDEK